MRQCNVNQTCVYLYAYTFRYSSVHHSFLCVYIYYLGWVKWQVTGHC